MNSPPTAPVLVEKTQEIIARALRELETMLGDLPTRNPDAHDLIALINDLRAGYQHLEDEKQRKKEKS